MDNHYKLPSVETPLNKFLSLLHYYRLLLVFITILGVSILSYFVWQQSDTSDKLKNVSITLTCGSILIGLFYSLINYENNQLKFKHDVKTSRELLTYNTSCKMYDSEMLEHFRISKKFHEENKSLFETGDVSKIDAKFEEDYKSRQSTIVVLNYLEVISIGINQLIIDEEFMKQFFKTIFKENLGRYGTYIDRVRVKKGNTIYQNFTLVSERWRAEG